MLNTGMVWGNPQKVYKHNNGYLLNFNTRPVGENYYYTEQVFVTDILYGTIVSAIVNAQYDSDQIEAITLNYLAVLDSTSDETKFAEYVAEYKALQLWRSFAKQVAKDAIEYVSEHDIS